MPGLDASQHGTYEPPPYPSWVYQLLPSSSRFRFDLVDRRGSWCARRVGVIDRRAEADHQVVGPRAALDRLVRRCPQVSNDETTGEGATSMGFFNVQAGDAPYFTKLAREYALSDNFHQAIQGGTGANHLMVGFGTTIYYADSTGAPATPPINQIENPEPQAGTNNWYTQDGYGGGSYVPCWDASKPGIGGVRNYLESLPYKTLKNDCLKNAYYLVNNYNPGYLGTGERAPLGDTIFTVPPTTQNNIGLLLSEHHISWKYYGEGWANGTETGEASTYCNIPQPVPVLEADHDEPRPCGRTCRT